MTHTSMVPMPDVMKNTSPRKFHVNSFTCSYALDTKHQISSHLVVALHLTEDFVCSHINENDVVLFVSNSDKV